jgi:O-6-methylguanine DNA methyltransferase
MGTTGTVMRLPWDVPVELVVHAPSSTAPARRGEGLELTVLPIHLGPGDALTRDALGEDGRVRPLFIATTHVDGRMVLAGIVHDIDELAQAWPAAHIRATSASPDASTSASPDTATLAATLEMLGSPLPVLVTGTDLSVAVLRALCEVPLGERITYAELAARAGAPRAVRAAARVMSTNVIPLVLPCHRVVPSTGGTGRYGWGADVKVRLLELERAQVAGSAT